MVFCVRDCSGNPSLFLAGKIAVESPARRDTPKCFYLPDFFNYPILHYQNSKINFQFSFWILLFAAYQRRIGNDFNNSMR